MDLAIRNAPADKKTEMRSRVASCKELVDKIRVEVLVLEKSNHNNDKAALMGEDHDALYLDMDGASQDQVMLETVALVKKGDDHLQEALRSVTELEDVAISINEDLSEQRDKIEGMQDRITEINQEIDRADGLMRQIYRRMMFNKIALGVGTTAVVGAVSLVLLKVLL